MQKIISTVIMMMYMVTMVPVELYANINKQELNNVEQKTLQSDSRIITPKEGGVIKVGEVEIEIPSGAVRKTTEIKVTKLGKVAELSEGMANVTTGAIGYRFEPKGTKFKKAVTIRMGFSKELLEDEVLLSNLYTYYYNEKKQKWEALPREEIDKENCFIVSKTTHFTDMINSTLVEPEGTEPVSININAIKNLEAADPNSGTSKLEGLKGTQKGEASFSIGLEIPGGRNGVKPTVNLQYSSDGGNGDCGQGFNLISGGSINIDTRYGVPVYTLEGDKEHYLLNGERLKLESNDETKAKFRCESQKRYEKIEANLKDGKVISWEVTDTNGKKDIYGNTLNSWVGKTEEEKNEWKIERTEDIRGNNVTYKYINDKNTLYLEEIRYTGNKTNKGLYSIKFELKERNDVRINGKNGYISKQRKLYEKVWMEYNEKEVWGYKLEYEENEFGKNLLKEIKKVEDRSENAEEYWNYEFKYIEAEGKEIENGKVVSLDGFTEVDEVKIPEIGEIASLNKSGSIGGGLNLYTGVQFFMYIPFVGKVTGAAVGNTTGYQNSQTRTLVTMQDINGDNLPDIVWKDGSDIKYYKNEGNRFSEKVETAISGISAGLDENIQHSFSVGINVGFGPLNGSVSGQFSTGSTSNQLIDVDRDGLVDYVEAGSNSYYKNEGGKYTKVKWGEVENVQKQESESYKKNKKTYLNIYAVQELVQSWKAEKSGIIRINQKVENRKGENEIKIYIETENSVREYTEDEIKGKDIKINKGDRIYFRVDTDDESEENTELDWEIEIEYKKIKYFEYLKEKGRLVPEDEYSKKVPEELELLYEPIEGNVYKLKSEWEELLTEESILKLIDLGKFTIPETLSAETYFKIRNEGINKIEVIIPAYTEYKTDAEGKQVEIRHESKSASVEEKIALDSVYRIDGTKGIVILKSEKERDGLKLKSGTVYNPEVLIRKGIQKLTKEEKLDLILSKVEWVEKRIYPISEGTEVYYKSIVSENTEPLEIITGQEKNVFLDKEESNSQVEETRTNGIATEIKYIGNAIPNVIGNDIFKERVEENLLKEIDTEEESIEDYYVENKDTGNYELAKKITSAQKEILKTVMKLGGIQVYEKRIESIKYYSNAELYVENDKTEIEIVVNGQKENQEIDVNVPTSTESFTTEDERCYVLNEYVTNEKDSDGNPIKGQYVENTERIQGGKNGWYYGLWSGCYEFNPNKIGKELEEEDNESIVLEINGNKEVVNKTLYTYTMKKSEKEAVMLGEITEVQETMLDENIKAITKVDVYAASYDGLRYKSERIGGPAYKRLKKTVGGLTGGGPSELRSNRSTGLDVSGGVSFVGSITGGTNIGTSWQYEGLMDVTGDGIPDVVSYDDTNDSTEYKYIEGSLAGFRGRKTGEGILNSITNNEYKSVTVGVGVGAGGGGANPGTDSKGRVNKITVVAPPEGTSGSGSVGVGVSGSGGINIVKGQYIDMNGDGLIDQVIRTENKNYNVLLGIGNGKYAKEVSWGGSGIGINLDTEDFGENLYSKTEGISTTSTGSVGANLNAGAGSQYVSGSLGGNISLTSNKTFSTLMDVNGDGLVDAVYKESKKDYFLVWYNTGEKFTSTPIKIKRPEWNSENFLDLMKNRINSTVEMVKVNTDTSTEGLKSLFEFNIEEVLRKNPVSCLVSPLEIEDVLDYSSGVNLSVTTGVTVNIPVWLLYIVIGTGGNFQYGQTTSTVKFMDMNGDGLPDHIAQVAGSESAQIKYNQLGKVGLLKEVVIPQGGVYEIEYESSGNTVDQPQHKYVMKKVTQKVREDWVNSKGINKYATEYDYELGQYNRKEMEFYGYTKVTSRSIDENGRVIGNTKETNYSTSFYDSADNGNSGYYKKGMVESERQYDEDNKLIEEINYTIDSYPYARILSEEITEYDSKNDEKITIKTEYTDFDKWGNVKSYEERADGKETIKVEIEYAHDESKYIHANPQEIKVYDGDNLIRKRQGVYNNYGELEELISYISEENTTSKKFRYDSNGNLIETRDARGSYIRYEYDKETCQYVEKIAQGGNNISEYINQIKWDKARGLKLKETDENSQSMEYKYDNQGRLKKIYSPYDEVGSTPAIEYEYHTEKGTQWWTETKNKISFDCDDTETISTVVLIDALGRKVKTAKKGEKTDEEGNSIVGWNISGAIGYDEKGRQVSVGQTYFSEQESIFDMLKEDVELIRETTIEYDSQEREKYKELPDGSIELREYGIEGDIKYTEIQDPMGNIGRTEIDARGNTVRIVKYDNEGKELTKGIYEYNSIGELESAYDAQENPITVKYDMLGRKISLESKDSGRKEYFYDASGNLIEETDSKLKKNGKSIKYEYDGMNRLVKIDYPDSTDITYYYGESNAEDNGANRVVKVTDETGMKSVSYGLLGEVVEESRTIGDYNRIKYNEKNKWWKYWWHNIHKDWWGRRHHKWYHRHHWHGRYKHHYPWYGEGSEEYNGPEYEDGAYTSKMSYTSDYLGRMAYITYPDGETISYSYDKGGQVTGVKGYRNEKETVYVSKIGYDEYGQRTYIEYGNGVKTSYTYDENRRWLDTIKTTSATDRILQNMTYNFDKVGNVRGYENIGENYKTAQNYKYDSLYQLVGVKGQTEYKPRWPEDHEDHHKYVSTYEQSFRFDNIGNMKSKYSEKLDKPHNQHTSSDLNYSFEYKYDPEYAHRTLSADNMYYSYDENGNIINERIDREATKEELEHDIAVADEVYSLDYGIALPNQPSVETKAYSRTYVWNERNLLRTSVENGLVVQYRYGEDGQRAVKSSSLGETLYFNNMWQMSTTPMGMRQTKHIFVGETRIATKNNWWQDTGTEYEKYNTYWYHADHLGSAQLVSNWKGEEYERIEYTPYGEIWVEKVKNGHESINYRFTGKEMDSETGLYYFGARYLDPKYSRWLSTDPALRDYIPQAPVNDEARKANNNLPGQGGLFNQVNFHLYHYAGNNPVRYIDPDGESPISIFIPNADEISVEEAQNWIDNFVCGNSMFPICDDMYTKSRRGDASNYVKGIDSYVSKKMASDNKSYVNTIIKERLAEGKTSGKSGRTNWSNLDLQFSLGSSEFSWKLDNYDSDTKKATVSVKITDNFDFNKGSGIRNSDAEKLTSLGRKAELTEYKVEITYILNLKVKMPED